MQKFVFILLTTALVIQQVICSAEDEGDTNLDMDLEMDMEVEVETTTIIPPVIANDDDKRDEELKRLEKLEEMFDNIITIETSNGTMSFDQFMDYEVNRYIHFYDAQTAFVLSEAAKLLQGVDALLANTTSEDGDKLEFRKAIKADVEQYLQRLFDGTNCGIRPIVILQASKFLQKLDGIQDDELIELWANHYNAVTEAFDAVGNVTEEKKARQTRFANDNEQLNSVYTFKFNKIYKKKCANRK